MHFAVDLHRVCSGSGSRPVLLLHGLLGSCSNLGALGRALAAEFQVWAVDLRNHGASPHTDSMDQSLMAADVLRLLDAENLDAVDIVGHSLGGKVAMQFAMLYPQRCRRLVVADIAPVASAPGHDTIFQALREIDPRGLKSRSDADRLLARKLSDPGLRQFLLKNLTRDEQGGWRWKVNLDVLIEDYDAVLDAPSGEPFTGPTLFIKAELSDYINADSRPAMRRLFPAHVLQEIPGVGHWLHAENPAAFNHLVMSFLQASETL